MHQYITQIAIQSKHWQIDPINHFKRYHKEDITLTYDVLERSYQKVVKIGKMISQNKLIISMINNLRLHLIYR